VKVEPVLYGDRKVYPVGAFNRGLAWYVRRLPEVWVEGEVTELRRSEAWATVFFTLKDPATGATLPATMQRRRFDRLGLSLAEGECVHAFGRAEVYEAKGELGFRVTTLERVGLGGYLAALERLKQLLASEGLFAEERKRRLPRFPRAVGVLTGADAAARGDILTALAARFPATRVVVHTTRVQGRGATESIVRGLAALTEHPLVDVVIVTRGGGSFEDLLPFSDEAVVRAIAACRVPVVTAVGHEQDMPLCDLAADARASTPTAAARLVVPDLEELRAGLRRARERMGATVRLRLSRDRERLERQRQRLGAAPARLVERRRAALDRAGARLQALAPHATLRRGYAIVRMEGRALRATTGVGVGAELDVELAEGSLAATVTEVRS
jgi:exodeoxyribonuclease VII large subunit